MKKQLKENPLKSFPVRMPASINIYAVFIFLMMFYFLPLKDTGCFAYGIEVNVQTAEKNKENVKEGIVLPTYTPYLKDSTKLGFSPDNRMFKSIYLFIRTQYVTDVDDSLLLKSCEKEVNRLLKEANLKGCQPFRLSTFDGLEKEVERLSSFVNKDLLYYSAIQGIILGLTDPYTVIMTPKEYRTMMEQMQAMTFGGIGVYLELDKENNNTLTVFEPIEGTPAYKCGIQPQDAILFINGESTKGMTLDTAVVKLRGPIGSQVTMTIKRPGEKDLKKVTITRENIKIHSVSVKVIDGKYGYIRIRTFGEETGQEMAKALQLLSDKNIKGLILDLRNNGGGYIDASVKVCSNFVSAGGVIVSVTNRQGAKNSYNSEGYQRLAVPLLVLVNKYSASASEITAGAVQDYKLGTLMGTKTFGKGSVQQIFPVTGGGAFKITTAHYFTPKGRNIDKLGIDPDIEVKMEPKFVGRKDDSQLKAAVKYFENKNVK